LILAIKKLKAS